LSEKFALRGGYYYDPAPSPANTLSILLPSISYNAFTLGVGYKTEKINLDFCLEYLTGKDRTLDYGQQVPDVGMPGIHGASMLVPNIAFTYRF
jgi:long-chain fatty acid transport protein